MSTMIVSLTTDQLKALIADAVRDVISNGALDLSKVVSAASSSAAPAKAKRVKKERDPDAPKKEPNDWIKFTSRVRSVLAGQVEDGKKMHPKAVTQTASKLKDASLMASATDEQIVAAYRDWLANPPAVSKMVAEGRDKKSKKSVSDGASSVASNSTAPNAAAVTEKKKGGRKKLTDMTAEERAAHDAKKAAKKAAKSAPSEPVTEPAAKSDADDAADVMDFEPFTWKKMSLLKNARGDVLTEDMEWFGHWDSKTDKVDTSAEQPSDLDL